jgi:hypothetical protein
MSADIQEASLSLSLRLNGLSPNIIRELSGVFPTFVSAFKELVSNSYDANASIVSINFSPDFCDVTVRDNGKGMTPFELQTEYLKIGGSSQRKKNELALNSRKPIGRKGIGFLAIARYCENIKIYSHSNRIDTFKEDLLVMPHSREDEGIPFFTNHFAHVLAPYINLDSVYFNGKELNRNQFLKNGLYIKLVPEIWKDANLKGLSVKYSVDFGKLAIIAVIDYDHILKLHEDINLEKLDDFCRLDVIPYEESNQDPFTEVNLQLKDFVQQELLFPRRRGRVRNIVSMNGMERFLWHLSRSTPVSYNLTFDELKTYNLERLGNTKPSNKFIIEVHNDQNQVHELNRPFVESVEGFNSESVLTNQEIHIEEDGLIAYGYILGFSNPIFPAELRGIAIRVDGVEIGFPNFLNIDNEVPIRYRTFLNQVIGEISVVEGIDVIDAITPGREGFYFEDLHYRLLRDKLVGDGVLHYGALGKVLSIVAEHSSTDASTTRIIQEAKQRRKALLDISQAITGISLGFRYGHLLRSLFKRNDIIANSLCHFPEYQTHKPNTIGSYSVVDTENLSNNYELDVMNKIVRINNSSDIWNTSLNILGRDFQISLRNGKPDGTLCEVDFGNQTIYVNWQHSMRNKLGDTNFIKTAVFWSISHLASNNDANTMIELALRLFTFAN